MVGNGETHDQAIFLLREHHVLLSAPVTEFCLHLSQYMATCLGGVGVGVGGRVGSGLRPLRLGGKLRQNVESELARCPGDFLPFIYFKGTVLDCGAGREPQLLLL